MNALRQKRIVDRSSHGKNVLYVALTYCEDNLQEVYHGGSLEDENLQVLLEEARDAIDALVMYIDA
jgi:hypothetical protein